MKNKTNRFLALLLTLAMVLPLAVPMLPASAEETAAVSTAQTTGPVADAAEVWDFSSEEQAADFDFYQSADSGFSIQDGMLVPSGANGEMKAISKASVQNMKFVSVDIIPGASGLINGGLYIGASNPASGRDQIDALAIILESWFTGWSDAPNRIDIIQGQFHNNWKELSRTVTETGRSNNLYTKGVKEPVNLRIDFEGTIITCTLSLVSNSGKYVQTVFECDPADLEGFVGIRADRSDVCFDNFKIGYDRAVPEKLQQGLDFQSVGAKATLSKSTGTIPQTVEAWVKIDETAAKRTGIIGSFTGPYTADAKQGDWALFTDESGRLWWYEKSGSVQYTWAMGPNVRTGDWVHVAISRTTGSVTFYINGSSIGTKSGTVVLGVASNKVPTLGYCEYGGENYNYMDGTIGDVRLWSTTRTAAEIQEDMFTEVVGNEEGLMNHWGLDEQAGTVIWDSTASGNHGSISKQTGLTWTEGSTLTEGLDFQTVGVKATLSKSTGTIPQTVEAWVKIDPDTAAKRTGIIGSFTGPYTADAQQGDWALFTDENGKLWWYEKNSGGQYSWAKGSDIRTGEWVHVAIARTSGSVTFYVNGTKIATQSGSIVLGTASNKVPTLGYCEYGGVNYNYMDGAIGDVRIWSTTRTQEEIQATMYENLTGTETGLMSNWKLDEQNGVNFADSTATANHGTIDVAWLKDNQGLEFAGNQGVVAPLSKATGTIPQTVEAWVKIDKTAAKRTGIIGSFTGPYTADAKQGDWALFTDESGRLWWYEKSGSVQYTWAMGPNVRTGDWVHVAISRTTGSVTFYINGSSIGTKSGTVVLGVASNKIPTLGYCEYGGENYNYMDGALRDVRLWSTTRTADQIKTNMSATLAGTEEGLMSYWKLDEQSGTTIKDSAAAGNDGTVLYGATWLPGIQSVAETAPEQTYDNEGFNFSQQKTWITSKELDISPDHTIEAWVKIPKAVKSANVLVKNNLLTRYQFSVTAGGSPRLYWKDENDTVTEIVVANAKVNTGKWTHVAFVSDASAKTVTCYVNGTAVHVAENVVLNDIVTRKFYVGNPTQGLIGDLRIWNKSLSAQEIQASMATAYTDAVAGLQLNVPFDEEAATSFRDLSGNENSIEEYVRRLDWYTDDTQPKDYSIVVIPDQQVLSSRYPEYLDNIYRWIAENAEEENIKFAINLGDITDYNSEPEWLLSLEALDKIKGIVPYSFVPGNHEYVIPGGYSYAGYGYRNLTEMNKYFGNIYDDQEEFGGTYDGGVENSWHEFEVCGNQYLVFAFEYAPRDSVLAWASEIIEAHPYHQVIVSTHGYMDSDGTRMGNISYGSGYGYLYEEGKEDPNSAREMWDEFVSQHENIIMVLCGHIATDDVVPRIDEGVNGNPVLQMLIDGQDLDGIYQGIGFLALMRFDANGENMELTYFSPYHGENGEDEYLNDNILSFTMPAPKKPVAQVGENTYTTVTEAAADANGEIVKILKDTDEEITIDADVTIDLAGCKLSNVTVAGDATLTLIDSATDDYEGEYGTATVSGKVAGGENYLLVSDENSSYSAHRYDVTITHISLDPAKDALGYKAAVKGDAVVQSQVTSIGFNLWLDGGKVNVYEKEGTDVTLRLKGILAAGGGEMNINATAFVRFGEQTETGAQQTVTMKQTLQMVNAAWADYSETQQNAVKALCDKYAVTQNWELTNIYPVEEVAPAA